MNPNRLGGQRFKIEGGPSKGKIWDAFKYANDQDVKIPLDFSVAEGYSAPLDDPRCCYLKMPITEIVILKMEYVDESSYLFNLSGWVKFSDMPETSADFEALYNCKSRKGWMRFT